MKVFDNITLKCDVEELTSFCHLNYIKDKIENFEAIIEEGYGLLDPKAMYTVAEITEVKGDQLILRDGHVFESNLLAEKFKCNSEIAVYIVTIGSTLERHVTELGPKDLSRSFIIDCIGTYALNQIHGIISKDFRPRGGDRISKFSPGATAYWDLRQQKVLFDILGAENVEKITGVRLNEYYIMIPKKTVSGVMGDTEEQFHECQICKRRCEYRRAPFKG